MSVTIDKLARCIEFGKINRASPYPTNLKDQDGADEITKQLLKEGYSPDEILQKGFIAGMNIVGKKFSENKIFVPQMLMSAKAMSSGMEHLKPFFQTGEIKKKGTFVIGTVAGDLHDIGKNLVAMMIEGAGWEVVDLGTDVHTIKFMEAIDTHPDCSIGLSALLTTTMINMRGLVNEIKHKYSGCRILVGGAPLSQEFCDEIGANFYSPNPQGAVDYLDQLVS